jgi:hypothetical protein
MQVGSKFSALAHKNRNTGFPLNKVSKAIGSHGPRTPLLKSRGRSASKAPQWLDFTCIVKSISLLVTNPSSGQSQAFALRSFESPLFHAKLSLARPLRADLIRTEGKFGDGAKRVFQGWVPRRAIALARGLSNASHSSAKDPAVELGSGACFPCYDF